MNSESSPYCSIVARRTSYSLPCRSSAPVGTAKSASRVVGRMRPHATRPGAPCRAAIGRSVPSTGVTVASSGGGGAMVATGVTAGPMVAVAVEPGIGVVDTTKDGDATSWRLGVSDAPDVQAAPTSTIAPRYAAMCRRAMASLSCSSRLRDARGGTAVIGRPTSGHPTRPVLHSRPVRGLTPSHQRSRPRENARSTHADRSDRDGAGRARAHRPPATRSAEEENRQEVAPVPSVSMRQLLEAGVHFGHQTSRWNPKMKPYIFAERNGIHIIDLAQTVQRLDVALEFVRETVARGDQVLFVGTKKQAQEPVAQEATRANQPYVNKRWLGGMLTNFVTIKKRIGLLEQLEARQANGDFERMTKKEAAKLTEEMVKLQGTLGGMRKMKRLPGAIFIVDPHRERIGVTESNKLEIPVVGTGDTNVDPAELDYIIPANDDAIREIQLLCRHVSDEANAAPHQSSARSAEPEVMEPMAASEPEEEIPGATDELVAALAGGAALSFDPGIDDDDDLLPGDRAARAEAAVAEAPEASAEEIAAELAR